METYLLLHQEEGQWVFAREGTRAEVQEYLDKTVDKKPESWNLYCCTGTETIVLKSTIEEVFTV